MQGFARLTAAACCALPWILDGLLLGADARPGVDYAPAVERLGRAVREQMDLHGIRGISVALVDDQRIVHAAGFGTAKRDSVFRAVLDLILDKNGAPEYD